MKSNRNFVAMIVFMLCIVGMIFPLAGCGKKDNNGDDAEKPELLLYCGAGIKPAAEALIKEFKNQTGISVVGTYAGSGQLLAQIETSNRGDLYMPGAKLYVDQAVEKKLAHANPQGIVAYFIPVIFVQKTNPKKISSVTDFTKPGLRLAIGDERACAVGRKTLKILKKYNLPYDSIAGNVKSKTATVNELALAIQLKQADATIVWDANAKQFSADGDAVNIPPKKNSISTIPLVTLKSSRNLNAAKKFVEFATGEKGNAIMKKNGYSTQLPY